MKVSTIFTYLFISTNNIYIDCNFINIVKNNILLFSQYFFRFDKNYNENDTIKKPIRIPVVFTEYFINNIFLERKISYPVIYRDVTYLVKILNRPLLRLMFKMINFRLLYRLRGTQGLSF